MFCAQIPLRDKVPGALARPAALGCFTEHAPRPVFELKAYLTLFSRITIDPFEVIDLFAPFVCDALRLSRSGHVHPIARREFLAGMAAVTAAHAFPVFAMPTDSSSPFRISVINDEISQDFGHACEVAAREFGMGWIELRSMWKKNIVSLDEKEVAEARRILEKYH